MTEVTEPGSDDATDEAPDDLTGVDARIAAPHDFDLDQVGMTDGAPLDEDVAIEQGAEPLPDEPEDANEPAGMVAGDDHISPKEDATDA